MPPKPANNDSSKIRLIPEMMQGLAMLNKVIITGDIEHGDPGLLENVRNTRKDVEEIKATLSNYSVLEQRVTAIEKRHADLDREKERKHKRIDSVTVALIIFAITQTVEILYTLLAK